MAAISTPLSAEQSEMTGRQAAGENEAQSGSMSSRNRIEMLGFTDRMNEISEF